MRTRLTGLAIAVALAAGAAPSVAQQSSSVFQVTAMRDGGPAANVQVDMQLLNQGKVAAGVTGAGGDLALALSLVNAGKPTRMQVVIYDCPNNQQLVVFVETGAEVPENLNCKRRVAGWLWFGRARAVTIDVARGTMQVQGGQNFLGSTRGRLILGGGAAAVGVGLLANGGSDSSGSTNTTGNPGNTPSGGSGTPPPTETPFDPNGNYRVTNTVGSDPGGHRFFVLMEDNTLLLVTITGSTVTITCPPGSKWTLLTGTFNPTTGQIAAEGRGTAAGFNNVLFRLAASIVLSGSTRGAITGVLTVGPNGELNGGPPITYNIAGARQ